MKFKDELEKLDACSDAVGWVGNMDLSESWQKCERGDWMLWYLKKTEVVDLRKLTLIKVECAVLVKHLMTDDRSLKALEVARSFAEGNATTEEPK